jgi:phospholipid-binding lipoprotein MlaA
MYFKFKINIVPFVLLTFILVSTSFAARQDKKEYTFLSNEDTWLSSNELVLAQSDDFLDDDFYFPDDLIEEESPYDIADPLRPFNVAMFHFNDRLYFWVFKPAAQGWRKVVPEIARTGIDNFFYNLGFPIRFVNSLLQLNGEKATFEVGRFFLNTIFGVLGFGNPAKNFEELNPAPQDLGLTFGRYGIGHGIYLVLPFFGPSSLRDGVGLVGDSFLNPINYVDPFELAAGIKATDVVNRTSFRIGDYEAFKDAALVPYDSMKSAFLQRRLKRVEN